MTKAAAGHGPRTERAIIDALLKISEIVQKTEAGREHRQSMNSNKRSRKLLGDGDTDRQQVPVPPQMRTLDSHLSALNHRPIQQPSNCNQASIQGSKQCAKTYSHRLPAKSESKPLPERMIQQQYATSPTKYPRCNETCHHRLSDSLSSWSSSSSEERRKDVSKDHWQHRSKKRKNQSVGPA